MGKQQEKKDDTEVKDENLISGISTDKGESKRNEVQEAFRNLYLAGDTSRSNIITPYSSTTSTGKRKKDAVGPPQYTTNAITSLQGTQGDFLLPLKHGPSANEQRAQAQRWYDITGNAVGRLAGTTATKLVQGVGFLAGLAGIDNKGKLGESWVVGAAENGLAKIMGEAEEHIKEALPIYKTQAYQDGTVWRQMMEPEFWADDVVDGAAFMLSSIAGTKGLGAAGKLSKVSALTKAGLKSVTSANKAQKIFKGLDLATRTAVLSASEAMHEAKGVKDAIINKHRGTINPATGNYWTEEELIKKASTSAADAFSMNMIALAPSNLLEVGWIMKAKPSASGMNMLRNAGNRSGRIELRELGKFEKFMNKGVPSAIKGFGKGFLAEGLYEENIQHSISMLNELDDQARYETLDWWDRMHMKFNDAVVGTDKTSGMWQLGDQERLKAVMLGGIIGGPVSLISSVREDRNRVKRAQKALEYLNETNQKGADFFKKSDPQEIVYEKNEEGEYTRNVYKLDNEGKIASVEPIETTTFENETEYKKAAEKDGIEEVGDKASVRKEAQPDINPDTLRPEFDEKKVLAYAYVLAKRAKLTGLLKVLESTKESDQAKIAMVRASLKASTALQYFSAGEAELLYEKLEGTENMSPAEMEIFGFDHTASTEEKTKAISKIKEDFKALENAFNEIEVLTERGLDESEEAYSKRKSLAFEKAAVQQELQALIDSISQQESAGLASLPLEVQEIERLAAKVEALKKRAYNQSTNLFKSFYYDLTLTDDPMQQHRAAMRELESKKAAYKKKLEEQEESERFMDPNKIDPQDSSVGVDPTIEGGFLRDIQRKKNTLRLQELNEELKAQKQVFSKIVNPLTGYRNFTELKEKNKYRTFEGFQVTDKTTLKEYEKHEEYKMPLLEFQVKDDMIATEEFSNKVNSVLDALENSPNKEEDVKALVDQVVAVMKNYGYSLTPDVFNRLLDIASPLYGDFSLESALSNRITDGADGVDISDLVDLIENRYPSADSFTEESLKKDFSEDHPITVYFEEIKSVLIDRDAASNSSLDFLTDNKSVFTQDLKDDITEAALQLMVAEDIVTENERTIVYAENTNGYANVEALEASKTAMEGMLSIMDQKKEKGEFEAGKKAKSFAALRDRIEEDIKSLEQLIEVAKKNREEAAVSEAESINNASNVIAFGLGIDAVESHQKGEIVFDPEFEALYKTALKEDTLAHIRGILVDNKFSMEAFQVVEGIISKKLKSSAEFKALLAKRESDITEKILGLKSFFGKYFNKSQDIEKTFKKYYAQSPIKAFRYVINSMNSIGVDESNPKLDSQDTSPVFKFLRNLNATQFIVNLKKEDPKVRGEEVHKAMITMAELHLKMLGYNSMKTAVYSSADIAAFVKRQQDTIDENNKKKTKEIEFEPSAEQSILIYEAFKFLNKRPPTQKEVDEYKEVWGGYSDFMTIYGPAGSGKSTVFTPWLLKTANIKSQNIRTAAPRESAAKVINDALKGGPTGARTIASLIDELKSMKADDLAKIRLLVLDEAGLITADQMKAIRNIVEEANKNRKGSRLKVLLLGDPNQRTAGIQGETKAAKAPIDSIGTFSDSTTIDTQLPPMTKVHRSSVNSLIDVQNMFNNQIKDMTKLDEPIGMESNIDTEYSEQPVLYGVRGTTNVNFYDEVRKIVAAKKSTDTRSRAVVVDEAEMDVARKELKRELESGAIELISIEDIQSQSVYEAYIKLDPKGMSPGSFNQNMYVAISRARNFALISGINSKNTANSNLAKEVDDRIAIKESSFSYPQHVKDKQTILDGKTVARENEVENIPEDPEETVEENQDENEIKDEAPAVEEKTVEVNDEEVDPDGIDSKRATENTDQSDEVGEQEVPESKEEEINTADPIPDGGGQVDTAVETTSHRAAHPTNDFLGLRDKETTKEHAVKPGDKVYYVPVYPPGKKKRGQRQVVKMLVPKKFGNTWYLVEVGQLGQQDYDPNGKQVGEELKSTFAAVGQMVNDLVNEPVFTLIPESLGTQYGKKIYSLTADTGTESAEVFNDPKKLDAVYEQYTGETLSERPVLFRGTVTSSQRLQIKYDLESDPKEYKSDKALIKDTLTQLVEGLIGPRKEYYKSLGVTVDSVVKSLVKKTTIHINNTKETVAKKAQESDPIELFAGITYMHVPAFTVAGTDLNIPEMQIQLTPRKLKEGDYVEVEIDGSIESVNIYQRIENFIANIKNIEQLLQKELGLTLTAEDRFGSTNFNSFVREMGLYKAKEDAGISGNVRTANLKGVFQGIKPSDLSTDLFRLIDEVVTEVIRYRVKEIKVKDKTKKVLKSTGGPLQIALADVSRSNLMSGSKLIRRVIKQAGYTYVFPELLPYTPKSAKNYSRFSDEFLAAKKRLVNQILTQAQEVTNEGESSKIDEEKAAIIAENLLTKNKSGFSIQDLEEIFKTDNKGVSSSNGGFGLRASVPMTPGEEGFGAYVGNSVSEVIGSDIKVEIEMGESNDTPIDDIDNSEEDVQQEIVQFSLEEIERKRKSGDVYGVPEKDGSFNLNDANSASSLSRPIHRVDEKGNVFFGDDLYFASSINGAAINYFIFPLYDIDHWPQSKEFPEGLIVTKLPKIDPNTGKLLEMGDAEWSWEKRGFNYALKTKATTAEKIVDEEAVQAQERLNIPDDLGFKKKIGGEDVQGSMWTSAEAVAWLKSKIPGISDENIRFVEKGAILRMFGSDAWGVYHRGVIYLESGKGNTVYSKVVRHEAIHFVLDAGFDPAEKARIIKQAREDFNIDNSYSDYQVEEVIADRFMSWKRSSNPAPTFWERIFNKIKKFFGFTVTHGNTIQDLYRRIDRGMIPVSNNGRWDSVARFKGKDFQKNFINSTVYRVVRNSMLTELNFQMFGIQPVKTDFASLGSVKDITKRTAQIYQYAKVKKIEGTKTNEYTGIVKSFEEAIPYTINTFNRTRKNIETSLERLKSEKRKALGSINPKTKEAWKEREIEEKLATDPDIKKLINAHAVLNILTNPKKVKILIEELFPGTIIDEKTMSVMDYKVGNEKTSDEETEIPADEAERDKSIDPHIRAADEVNYMASVTRRVRNFFGFVPYENESSGKGVQFLRATKAWGLTLSVFRGIDTMDPTLLDANGVLMRRMESLLYKGVEGRVMYFKIKDIIDQLRAAETNPYYQQGRFMITERGQTIFVMAAEGVKTNMAQTPNTAVMAAIESYDPVTGDPVFAEGTFVGFTKTGSMKQLFDKILDKGLLSKKIKLGPRAGETEVLGKTQEGYEELNKLYRIHEAYSTFRDMGRSVISLYRKDVTSGYKKGANFVYSSAIDKSYSFDVSEDIITSVNANIETKGKDWLSKALQKKLEQDPSKLEKSEVIKMANQFLSEINMLIDEIQDYEVSVNVVNGARGINADVQQLLGEPIPQSKQKEDAEDLSEDSGIKVYGADDIVNMGRNGSRIRNIASGAAEALRADASYSYRRMQDGKVVSLDMLSSWADEALMALLPGDENKSRRERAEYANSPVFQNNPFFNSDLFRSEDTEGNAYHKSIDSLARGYSFHDGVKRWATDPSGIMYKEESRKDFLVRNFGFGFLGSIDNKTSGKFTYRQATWTPSERNNISSLETTLLDQGGIDFMLRQAVRQEAAISEMKLDQPVAHFDANKNTSYLYFEDEEGNVIRKPVIKNPTLKDATERAKEVKESLLKRAERDLDEVLEEVFIDGYGFISSFQSHYTKIKSFLPTAQQELWGEVGSANNVTNFTRTALYFHELKNLEKGTEEYNKLKTQYRTALLPLYQLWYLNNYANSYFLNQAIVGAPQAFKDEYDIMKRLSSFTSTRYKGFVSDLGNGEFMTSERRVIVIEDFSDEVGEAFQKMTGIYGANGFERTDGEAFMSTNHLRNIIQGFGQNAAGDIIKNVQAYVDKNGLGRIFKQSTVHASDKYAKSEIFNFKKKNGETYNFFDQLQKIMTKYGADEVVFKSTIKASAPVNTVKLKVAEEGHIEIDESTISEKDILTVPNQSYGLQFDPRHTPNGYSLNPSQITYMLALRGYNRDIADDIWQMQADYYQFALSKFISDMGLKTPYVFNNKDGSNYHAEKKLRDKLAAILDTNDMTSKQAALVSDFKKSIDDLENEFKNYSVSLNLPVISRKAIEKLLTLVSRNTVEIKFKGGNFVLQSAIGSDLKFVVDENNQGYAEVYLPASFRDQGITEGEVLGEEGMKIFGFRIPSSDIHSGLVIKVKGFLETNDNIIMAPPELVFFHGSDFDVDKLYLLREEAIVERIPDYGTPEDWPLSNYLKKQRGGSAGKLKMSQFLRDKDGKEPLHKLIDAELNTLKVMQKDPTMEPYLKEISQYYQELQKLYEIALKNRMVNRYIDALQKNDAWKHVYAPITMTRIDNDPTKTGGDQGVIQWLNEKGIKGKPTRDLNIPSDNMEMRMDARASTRLVGHVANFFKGAAYLSYSTPTPGEEARLRSDLRIKIDGGEYATITSLEKQFKEGKAEVVKHYTPNGKELQEAETWQTIDSIMNVILDNVKHQYLGSLGIVDKLGYGQQGTLNAYLAGLSIGMPLKTVTSLMWQPFLRAQVNKKEAYDSYKTRIAELYPGLDITKDSAAVTNAIIDEGIEITSELLEKSMSSNNEQLKNLTDEELKRQWLIEHEIYNKLERIAKGVSQASRLMNPIRNIEGSFPKIETWFLNEASIFKVRDNKVEDPVTKKEISKGTRDYVVEKASTIDERQDLTAEEKEELKKYNALSKEEKEQKEFYALPGLNDSFAFENTNLYRLPNVRGLQNTMKFAKTIVQNNFLAESKPLQLLSNAMITYFGGTKALKENFNQGGKFEDLQIEEAKEKIRMDFVRYLISSMKFKVEMDSYPGYGEEATGKVDFSTLNEEPITVTRNGREKELTDADAWVERFVQRLSPILTNNKTLDNPNEFLSSIKIKRDPKTGAKFIQSILPKGMDPADIESRTEGFAALGNKGKLTNLQYDLLKYLVIKDGIGFSQDSYALMMSPPIFSELSKNLDTKARDIMEKEDIKDIFRYVDHFAIQFALANSSLLESPTSPYTRFFKGKKITVTTREKSAESKEHRDTIMPDLMFSREEGDPLKLSSYPKFIKDSDNNLYVRLDKFAGVPYGLLGGATVPEVGQKKGTKTVASAVFYQKYTSGKSHVGMQNLDTTGFDNYRLETTVIADSYVAAVKDPLETTELFSKVLSDSDIAVGDSIVLRAFSDPYRTNLHNAQVVDIVEEEREISVKEKGKWVKKDEKVKVFKLSTPAPMRPENKTEFQLATNEESRAVTRTDKARNMVISMADQLAEKFGFTVEYYDDPSIPWKGFIDGNVVSINLAKATLDTPIHEFLHPFVKALKKSNPELYQELVAEINATEEGREVLREVKAAYAAYSETKDRLPEDFIEEAIVTLAGRKHAKAIEKGSLWDRFLDWVRRQISNLMGRPEDKGQIAKLGTLLMQQESLSPSEGLEFSLSSDALAAMSEEARKKYTQIKDLVSRQGLEVDKNSLDSNYTTASGKRLARATEWSKETFSSIPDAQARAERSAEAYFRNEGKSPETGTVFLEGVGNLTFNELVAYRLRDFEVAAAYGNYVHLIFEKQMNSDVAVINNAEKEMNQILQDFPELDENTFAWLDNESSDVIQSVAHQLGINLQSLSAAPVTTPDQILTEVKIGNDILGIGTAIDGVVIKDNGNLAIYDWKTGKGFFTDRYYVDDVMKWGEQIHNIDDTNLNRGKLQIALRALMLKYEIPDARFEALSVVHVTREGSSEHPVDLDIYLDMIKDYLLADKAEHVKKGLPGKSKYDQFIEKVPGIFNSKNYVAQVKVGATRSGTDDFYLKTPQSNASSQEWIQYWTEMLNKYTQRYSNPNSSDELKGGRSDRVKQRIKEITEKIQDLKRQPGTAAANVENINDVKISWFRRWMGNLWSADSKLIQLWRDIFVKQRAKVWADMDELKKEYSKLLDPVIDYYHKKNGITKTQANITGYNFQKFWSWAMEKKSVAGQNHGYYLIDDSKAPTEAHRKLLRFMKDRMKEQNDKVMNRVIYTEEGLKGELKEVTMAEAMKKTHWADLPDNFMPRMMKSREEMIQEAGAVGAFGASLKYSFDKNRRKFLGDYVYFRDHETNQVNDLAKKFIPVKYYGNQEMIESESHSKDLGGAFLAFMGNMVEKEHLDEVIGLADGIKTSIETSASLSAAEKERTKGFLDDQILLQILKGRKSMDFASKTWDVKIGDKRYAVNFEGVFDVVKGFTTRSAMWLKMLAGTRNGALILSLNHKDALKGSLMKRFVADKDDIMAGALDYSTKHLIRAEAEWLKLQKDAAFGKLGQNKMFNLAKKMRFLTDNYDFKVDRGDNLVGGSKIFKESSMYVFHSHWEDFGNYSLMAAQMMAMKHPKTGKSMWDHYNDQGEYTGPQRGIIRDTTGAVAPLMGLTDEEIVRLKRVTARIHGGYREDERTSLELYALGRWMLQFRKYMPEMLLNIAGSRYADKTMGRLVEARDEHGMVMKENGETIYEWQAKVTQGKYRLMLHLISQWAQYRNQGGLAEVWKRLSYEERAQLVDMMTSLATTGLWIVTYFKLFGDDDEEGWTGLGRSNEFVKTIDRLFREDITQGLNPNDWLRNANTPAPAISRLWNISNATWDFFVAGLMFGERTQEGNIKGEMTLRKIFTGPFGEWAKYMKNLKEEDEEEVSFSRLLFGRGKGPEGPYRLLN